MATSGPTNLPAFFSNSTDFRAWVTGIHNALAAIGLVQTADTGQIAPASVALPGAINTSAGYEIWKLNDTLQATVPYFFKIEYGTGGAVDRPSLWLTVGSTTNGAGTLGGQLGSRQQAASASSKTAGTNLPLYASGDGSRFVLAVNADNAATGFGIFCACERTRDSTGAYTSDGIKWVAFAASTGAWQCVPASGSVPGGDSNHIPLIPCSSTGGSQHATATDAALATVVYFIGKPFYGLNLANVVRADVGSTWGATFTATVLGATHTFITLLGGFVDYLGSVNSGTNYLCILWE